MLSQGSDIVNYVVLNSSKYILCCHNFILFSNGSIHSTRRVVYWRVTVIWTCGLLAITKKLHLSVNVTVLHNFMPASTYVYVYIYISWVHYYYHWKSSILSISLRGYQWMINVGSFLYFIAYTIDYISFLTSSQTYLEENIPN